MRAEEAIYGMPYRSAIVPHIADLTPSPSPDVTEKAEEAERELTRFDAELGARVSEFAPVLLRSEASSSSQIENLTASARAVFSAELGAKGSRNAGDVAEGARMDRDSFGFACECSVRRSGP